MWFIILAIYSSGCSCCRHWVKYLLKYDFTSISPLPTLPIIHPVCLITFHHCIHPPCWLSPWMGDQCWWVGLCVWTSLTQRQMGKKLFQKLSPGELGEGVQVCDRGHISWTLIRGMIKLRERWGSGAGRYFSAQCPNLAMSSCYIPDIIAPLKLMSFSAWTWN